MALNFLFLRSRSAQPQDSRSETTTHLVLWWLLLAGAITLAVVGDWRLIAAQDGLRLDLAAWWWFGALAVVQVAAAWRDWENPRPSAAPWRRADVLAFASILVVSAAFRLWRITEYPAPDRFGFEEFQSGGVGFATYESWAVQMEFPVTGFLPGLSFKLFGLNSYALRLPFLLAGIAAPVVLFTALRRVVLLPAAWAAAMLLAVNRWAVTASRFADEIFLPLVIVALAAWLAVRVTQHGTLTVTWWLAVVGGILMYEYTGYRVLPVLAYGMALISAVGDRWRGEPRRVPRGALALVAATWMVILSPAALELWITGGYGTLTEGFFRHGFVLGDQGREGVELGRQLAQLGGRLRDGWALFATHGDELPWINVRGAPMFDAVTAGLTAVAVLWAVVRVRAPWRSTLLVLVLVPFVLLGIIPVNLNVQRYFVLLVPLFALIGLFLDDALGWRRMRDSGRRVIAVGLVAVVGVLNARALERVIESPEVRVGFEDNENRMLAAIHALPARTEVILLTMEGANALEPSDYVWLTQHLRGGRVKRLAEALTAQGRAGPVSWVVQGKPEGDLVTDVLRRMCRGTPVRRADAYGIADVITVNIPAQCGPPPLGGLRGRYRTRAPDGEVREATWTDPALTAYTLPWDVVGMLQSAELAALDVEWEGLLLPPQPGSYVVRLEVVDATGSVTVAGRESDATETEGDRKRATITVDLADNPVPITVRLHAEAGQGPRVRLQWRPPAHEWQIVGPEALRPAP